MSVEFNEDNNDCSLCHKEEGEGFVCNTCIGRIEADLYFKTKVLEGLRELIERQNDEVIQLGGDGESELYTLAMEAIDSICPQNEYPGIQ